MKSDPNNLLKRAKLQQAAIDLVQEVHARGETIPDIDKKLAALGLTSN